MFSGQFIMVKMFVVNVMITDLWGSCEETENKTKKGKKEKKVISESTGFKQIN